MIKKTVMVWFILVVSLLSQENQTKETKYPFPILGGTTVRVPASQDTLWVLKHSQFKRALKTAKKYEIDTLRIKLLQEKLALYQQIAAEKDSVIASYKDGYLHYRDLWTDTSFKLEEAEVKASKRWRFFQVGFLIGIAVTVGLTAYFRSI